METGRSSSYSKQFAIYPDPDFVIVFNTVRICPNLDVVVVIKTLAICPRLDVVIVFKTARHLS